MKVNFEDLKSKISLPDFLLQIGWSFTTGTSPARPKMTDGNQTIVIKKNNSNHYTYWDVHDESSRGKTILDVMSRHLFNQTGRQHSLREVGEILQNYLDNNIIVSPDNSKYKVNTASLSESDLSFLIKQLKEYSGNYLANRGIKDTTLASTVFAGVFKIRNFKKDGITHHNVCTEMYNRTGFQGISQRNIEFKGILGSKFDCLTTSKHDKTRPIDTVYIGESIIDCISHYQLKNIDTSKNILYLSSEGTLTEGQTSLIKFLVEKHNIKDIVSIFDNDENGMKYSVQLNLYLKGRDIKIEDLTSCEIKSMFDGLNNIDKPTLKDWNEDLTMPDKVLQKTNDLELLNAFHNGDFAKVLPLIENGYTPSPEVIDTLKNSNSKIMIAVKTIFNIPLSMTLDDIELASTNPRNLTPNISKEGTICL